MQEELEAVRDSLDPLQKKQVEELMKDKYDGTLVDQLHEAIAPLAAAELELLDRRMMLETQPEGEQWGTAPDAWRQAAHLVLGPFLRPEDRLPPEFPR